MIGIVNVTPRENFVTIARGIVEIDRRAARDAMSGRSHFNRDVVLTHDVAGMIDIINRFQEKRHVVKLTALFAQYKSNVVRLVRTAQEGAQLHAAVVVDQLLPEIEVQHLDEELRGLTDVRSRQQHVV